MYTLSNLWNFASKTFFVVSLFFTKQTNTKLIYKQWISAKHFRRKISHIGKRLQHYCLRNFIINYMRIIGSVMY